MRGHAWILSWQLLTDIEQKGKELTSGTPLAGLSVKQVHVLHALMSENGLNASVLASKVSVPSTSFTPTLDELQKKGFIERGPDLADRRGVRIYLTAKGESVREKVIEVVDALNKDFERRLAS